MGDKNANKQERKEPHGLFRMIQRGDAYSIGHAMYHFGDEHGKKLEKMHAGMRARRFRAADVLTSPRVLNHWANSGVLPEGCMGEGGWRSFTLVEVLWLHVVRRMRAFGVPLDMIANVTRYVMEWDEEYQTYNLFEYYVYEAITSDQDVLVVLFPDGSGDVGNTQEVQSVTLWGTTDMLTISLDSILEALHIEKKKKSRIAYVLDDLEQEALRGVRVDAAREVVVHAGGGKIKEVEIATTHAPEEWHALSKEVHDDGQYAELTKKTAAGETQSVEKRRKVRARKATEDTSGHLSSSVMLLR